MKRLLQVRDSDNFVTTRVAADLSQYELAAELNLTQAAISLIELGQRATSFETAWAIANCLGVPIDDLFVEKKRRRRLKQVPADRAAAQKHDTDTGAA